MSRQEARKIIDPSVKYYHSGNSKGFTAKEIRLLNSVLMEAKKHMRRVK